jgi:CHAT domain-containing protein
LKTKSCYSLFVLLLLTLEILCTSCTPKVSQPLTYPTSNPEKIKSNDIENLLQEGFKLYHQGHFAEAAHKIETATHIVPKGRPTSLEASLYTLLAFLQERTGDTEESTRTLSLVGILFQRLKSIPPESEALAQGLIRVAWQLKVPDRLQFWERLRPIASASHGKAGEAGVMWQIGEVYILLNNFQKAYECSMEALKLARDSREPVLEVYVSMVISRSLIGLGRRQEAGVILQEVLIKTSENPLLKANTLSQLGLVNAMLGREDQTIKCFQDAITLARSIRDTNLEVRIEFVFATAYFELKKPKEALKKALVALNLFEKLGDTANVANVEGVIAEAYFRNSSFEEAKQHAFRAAELNRQLGNRIEEAKNLRLAGQSLWASNKTDDALKALEKAALIQVDEKDRDGILQTLWAAVILFKSAGRIEDAKQVLLMALKTHTSVFSSDLEGERMIRWELASVCNELGHYSEALEQLAITFSIYDKLQDKQGKVLALIEMAQIHAELNDYQNRIAALYSAETLAAEIDNPSIKIMILTHTAALFADAGYKVEELQRRLEALRLSRLINKQEEIIQLALVGYFYQSIGEQSKALEYFDDELKIAKDIGDRMAIARALISLASCYLSMNRYNDTITLAREAIETMKVAKSPMVQMSEFQDLMFEQFIALGLISSALEYQQKYEDALKVAQESLEVAGKSGNPMHIRDAYNDMGHLYLQTGKYTEAIEKFKMATQTIESLRWGARSEEHKIGLLSKRLSPYDGIIHASYELHRKNIPNKSHFAEEALNFAERTKGRVWAEQLSKIRAGLMQESVPLEVQNEDKDLFNKFIAAYQEYQNALTRLGISTQELKEKEEAKDIAWEKWESFQEKVRRQYPKYALLRYYIETPIQFKELAVKAEETLVLYKVTPDWIYVWVVKRIGGQNNILKFVRLSSKTFEIEKLIEKLVSPFGRGKYKEFDIKVSNELFDKILKPVLEGVETSKRLIIMPDGMLNILPFEVLVTGAGCGNDKKSNCFLGDQYNISYYPSAAILTFNREAVLQTVPFKGSLFAVGDPVYGPDDKRLNESQISSLLESAKKYASEFTLRSNRFRKGVEDKGYTFDRLAYSGLEVQKIKDAFENIPGDREVLVGFDASEGNIKSRDLTRYQYLHFAVHGILAFDLPYLNEPALVLAVDPDTKEDGFLTLSEIYGLKLNADLVTLSACKTGLGLRVSGEGVLGLSRAFINAGARAVLVSLWEVPDESTALFMEEFYRLLAQGIDKVEALKKAKEYLRMKGYENPFFWAPFILIGD